MEIKREGKVALVAIEVNGRVAGYEIQYPQMHANVVKIGTVRRPTLKAAEKFYADAVKFAKQKGY